MIARRFDFHSPARLDEALRLLEAGPAGAMALAGGMTLIPRMTLGLEAPGRVVDLKKIPELGGIREDGSALVVGATATHREIAEDPLVRERAPLLADAAALIGDVQVRNRGTIGGGVAHADPAGNYLPALLALDAVIETRVRRGGAVERRRLPAGEFFTGPMATALEPGEIVAAVRVPGPPSGSGGGPGATVRATAFRKFARTGGGSPIVCAAALVERKAGGGERRGCVVVGGASPVPVRVALPGSPAPWTPTEVEAAIRGAIDEPDESIGDANGSAEYRVEMAAVHGRRAVVAACDALDGGEPSA